MGRRRSSSGVTDFLSDLTDDVKDFVDDEIIDRGRDTERDLRRAGRNLTRDEARDRRDARRDGRRGDRQDELDELRRAVRRLASKVNALAESSPAAGRSSDLPIAKYDDLTVADIGERLPSLTQAELATVDAYERANANRSTLTGRIEALRGSEPWSGYDEQTVPDIRAKLTDADEATTNEVRAYEARHKNRQGVLDAATPAKSG